MPGLPVGGAVVVVTGASSGIGADTVRAFARRGATVLAVARRGDLLARLAAECGDAVRPVPLDVTAPGAAERVVAAAHEVGPVDVLVNNAGIPLHKPVLDTTPEEVDRIVAVNLVAPVRLCLAVLPDMVARRRGSIINVTSVAGYVPNPQETMYGATKAGLSRWSHGLAIELHRHNIHVGVVSPGAIETPIWEQVGNYYRGRKFPATVVADAIVDAVERGRVHVTAPRRYGIPSAMYPVFGGLMRPGIRSFARKLNQ